MASPPQDTAAIGSLYDDFIGPSKLYTIISDVQDEAILRDVAPRITIDTELPRSLLFRDFVARRLQSWQLLAPSEWDAMLQSTDIFRRGTFAELQSEQSKQCENVYTVNRRMMLQKFRPEPFTWETIQKLAIQEIDKEFRHVTPLLQEFNGLLIAAGGAVCKALVRSEHDYIACSDVDLFFVDFELANSERPEEEKIKVLNCRLNEAIAFLSDLWLNKEGEETKNGNPQVFVLRNEHVVTIKLFSDSEEIKYQFVLRLYPSIEAVLGGFDIGPAMVAYTGWKIVGIELGAWSALARTLIIDISRRSTSFESRISKYNRFCHLIFPGLPASLSKPRQVKTKEEVITILADMVHANRPCPCGGPGCSLNMTAKQIDYDAFETSVKALARLHGLEIVRTSYDYTRPLVGDKRESILDVLTRQARSEGYFLAAEDFIKELKEEERPEDMESVTRIRPILKLPRLDINHHIPDIRRGEITYWSVRPTKDPTLNFQLTDYYGEAYFRVHPTNKRSNRFEASDYNDNPIWPLYTAALNLAALLSGRPEHAVSVFVLQKSDTKHRYVRVESGGRSVYKALKGCIVNVDECPSFKGSRPGSKESMLEIVETSSVGAYLGNILKLFDNWTNPDIQYRWPDTIMAAAEAKLSDLGKSKKELEKEMWNTNTTLFEDYKKKGLDLLGLLRSDLEKRLKARLEQLEKGPQWILKNPGRQWTSSINPMVGTPKDWYGRFYRSFLIGNKDMESTLRLARRRPGNGFHLVPNDIFKMILCFALCADAGIHIYGHMQ